jgi:hypothetical protein
MLYTVEIDFLSPEHEPEWNAWYHGNLPLLLAVPGFDTAQRFERAGRSGYRFLAAYTLTTLDAFEREEYRAIGGGGTASAKWKEWISRRRNVQSGLDWMPEVTESGRVLLTERDPAEIDLPDVIFIELETVALAKDPPHRHIAVTSAEAVERSAIAAVEGVAVYRPMAAQHSRGGQASRP